MLLFLLLKVLEESFFVGLLKKHGVLSIDKYGIFFIEFLMRLVMHNDGVDAAFFVVGEEEFVF